MVSNLGIVSRIGSSLASFPGQIIREGPPSVNASFRIMSAWTSAMGVGESTGNETLSCIVRVDSWLHRQSNNPCR